MFKRIITTIGGNPTERDLQQYHEIGAQIAGLEQSYRSLTDSELRSKTDTFRQHLTDATSGLVVGEARRNAEEDVLESILIDAFATVREVSMRTIGLRHYEVQLVGGQVLHAGRIAEMRTGEGKTLVATLPLYLDALTGRGAHLVTVNDYLARRDAKWMGPIFHFLGMQIGILQDASRTEHARNAYLFDPDRETSQEETTNMRLVPRHEAYRADITYGTNNEFGFDYLRDNMARSIGDRSQRGLEYAIIDEVDNVLIDGARTPLIISGPAQHDPQMYIELARVVRQLEPEHYEVDERARGISLSDEGYDRMEEILEQPLRDPDRPEDITIEQAQLLSHLEQAMRAEFLFKRNKDYLLQAGRVVIVDGFTGRVMPGRRWSDGLHQAVEAKEGVKVQPENATYATITLQNFFRQYGKLAGMSGTAVTEAEEFDKIYSLDVVPIPTQLDYRSKHDHDLMEVSFRENGSKFSFIAHKSVPDVPVLHRRKDYDDLVYRTEEAKLRALVHAILGRHVVGQPMLIGTTSVESSETLSRRLRVDEIRKLVLVWLLRDCWFEDSGQTEDGRAVPELTHLNQPIEQLRAGDMRPLARELELKLNPTDPDNLARLAAIVGLGASSVPDLKRVLDGGIPHQVLNAKKHDEESMIIARAGELGAVTIATNMAGRGVDIKLGGEISEETLASVNRVLRRAGLQESYNMANDERLQALEGLERSQFGIYSNEVDAFLLHMANERKVRDIGGMHVIGSERHEARRIDNQLRGRASRQGDPGSSRFYLSLEDELMRRFGGSSVSNLMERLNIDEAMPIEHGMVNKSIEQSQTRVEGANFDVRKHLLEYDDVLNVQRAKFYDQRNRAFVKDDLTDDIETMLAAEVTRRVELSAVDQEGWWRLLDWLDSVQPPQLQLDGTLLFPFSIEIILDEIGKTIPELAQFWSQRPSVSRVMDNGAVITGEHESNETAGKVTELLQKDSPSLVEHLPTIKAALLEMASQSAAKARDRLLSSIAARLETLALQIMEGASSKRELSDMTFEGAEAEARETGQELQISSVAKQMLDTAGIAVSLSKDEMRALTYDNLREEIGRRVESAAGTVMLSSALRGIESRTKLELGLDDVPTWGEIDWDDLQDHVLDRLILAQNSRIEHHLTAVSQSLDDQLTGLEQLHRTELGRLVLDMAYSRDVIFHQTTHQRLVRLEQRFPYIFHAAELLDGVDKEVLSSQVLDHLHQAHRVRRQAWWEAELQRLSAARIDDLDSQTRARLQIALGVDVSSEITQVPFSSLRGDVRDKIRDEVGRGITVRAHRQLILMVSDQLWIDYLTTIEGLRTSIGLEAYAQRDPLTAYKSQAFDMFQQLLVDMRAGVVSRLFTWQPQELTELHPSASPETRGDGKSSSTGRNDPCWCGSGKKFKNCHMRKGGQGVAASPTRPAPSRGRKQGKRRKQKQKRR